MKTIGKVLGVFFILASFASCSTVKVTDAWKDSRIQEINGGKVLVVFRADDNIARQRFEKDMGAHIKTKSAKFEVLPSYVNFPDANPENKLSPEKVSELRIEMKKLGVDIVIVTTVKSVQESVVTNVSQDPGMYSNYGYGGYGGGGYYSGRYNRGYYGSYGGMNMGYVGSSSTAITTTEKEFVVETLLYDLSLPESEQLLSVVTSLVDNPKSLVTTSDDFAKAVVDQLFKKN